MPLASREKKLYGIARADHIKRLLSHRHGNDLFLTEVKTGPTWFARKGELGKIDALAIKRSWGNPSFTGYEVKVDRGDFMNDDKWPMYLEYCHRFYFACPAELIRPDEVSKESGLIWVRENGTLYTKKKALFRKIDVPADMLYHLVISHMKSDREHPFFSERREYMEALVQDRADRRKLGALVSAKLGRVIHGLEKENEEMKEKLEREEGEQTARERVAEIANKYDIGGWSTGEKLDRIEKRLGQTVNPRLIQDLQHLKRHLERIC